MWWTLPASPRLHELRSFSLAFSAMLGAVTTIVGGVVDRRAIPAGPVLSLFSAAILLRKPTRSLPIYRVWNASARAYARMLTGLTTALSLAAVVVPSGVGTRAGNAEEGRAHWRPRHTQDATTYPAQHTSSPHPSRPGWLREYVHWARTSGNVWALALVPYLVILRGTAAPSEATMPHDIYTLY